MVEQPPRHPASDPSVRTFLAALAHPDKDVRQGAAVALGQLADPRIADEVAELLWDEPDFFVRETLTWVLTRTPGPAATAALAALASADSGHRLQALHLLSKIGDPDTVGAVLALIDDADPAVTDKARWSLVRIGDPSVIPALVDRLGAADLAGRDALTRTLAEFGGPVVGPLTRALTHPEARVRAHAAEVLGHVGFPAAVPGIPELRAALSDPSPEVPFAAAATLAGLVEHPPARDALRQVRESHPDPRVRAMARACC